jgi:hypothetical protein
MSYTPRYDHGDWIADCDICGRKYKASQLIKRWDGLMCCEDDWEIRQPQDFVRGVADTQIAPWLRPEPQDQFILVTIAQWLVYTSTTINSLVAQFIEGPSRQRTTSVASVVLNYFKVLPVSAGAREINGSSLNTNSIG